MNGRDIALEQVGYAANRVRESQQMLERAVDYAVGSGASAWSIARAAAMPWREILAARGASPSWPQVVDRDPMVRVGDRDDEPRVSEVTDDTPPAA